MDSSRKMILILVAGVVIIFGIVAVRSIVGSDEAAVPQEQPTRILVATRDIVQGSVVAPASDFQWKDIPKEQLSEDYVVEGTAQPEQFTGAIVRRQIRGGEPVLKSALTRAGEGGFLSAVLEPGMRAVSIAVSPTSGNAGFISPGDRVDLIVTHRIHSPGSTNSVEGAVVSETFVSDVRVIAVDQMLENPDNRAILAKTVTVEVTPRQAEQISVAGDLGKISMVLRSLANGYHTPSVVATPEQAASAGETPDENTAQTEEPTLDNLYDTKPPEEPHYARPYTRDSDVSGALEAGGLSSTIRVIRGDQVENVSLQ